MTLEDKINEEIKAAMKAKNESGLRAFRAIKAAILLAKTDGSGTDLDETGELKILTKLVKQRKESLAIFDEQNRADLAKVEREEIEHIQKFLPAQMDDEAVKEAVKKIVSDTGATSMKDMGKVMGLATKELAGKADGRLISEMVKGLLSS